MRTYFVHTCFLLLIGLFVQQQATAQNLLNDSSCEANYGTGSTETHFPAWTTDSGSVQCFTAVGFAVSTATPSEGDFFFGDASGSATGASQISQIVDLGGDHSAKRFFFSYAYRMATTTARPTHTADVEIYYLDASGATIGTLHNNPNFTDTQLNLNYITVAGVQIAPAGTHKIKWIVRWAETGGFQYLIMDNFILLEEPSNDICENAIPISCGDYVTGQTLTASPAMTNNDTPTVIDAYDNCQALPRYGVFYSIEGTGDPISLNTTSPYTNYNTQLSIYEGSCSAPICFINNDNITDPVSGCFGGDFSSKVTFPTIVGETYYIYVSGNTECRGERGRFGLNVDCTPYTDINCGESINGTTIGATNDYNEIDFMCPQSNNYPAKDVLYKLEVTETQTYAIILSNLQVDLDLFVMKLDGDYNITECIDFSLLGSTSNEIVTATLTPGTYGIIIDGYQAALESPFTLTVDCEFNTAPKYTFSLDLKVLLQGPLKAGTLVPVMDTDLNDAGLLPTKSPDHLGTIAEYGFPTNIVDWVIVELRDPTDNTIIKVQQACLLQQDGKVISADGSPNVVFEDLSFNHAYVVVRHRNHLGVMNGALVIAPCGFGIPITCGQSISSSNAADDDTYGNTDYNCASATSDYDGKDVVYEMRVVEMGTYTITLSNLTDDLDLFLMEVDAGGNFVNCLASGLLGGSLSEVIEEDLSPGCYVIVVDAYTSLESPFTLSVSCMPIY